MSAELLSAARDWADADPVHARVGGEYTTAEFDADPVAARVAEEHRP